MESNFLKLLEISNELEKNNKPLNREDPAAFKTFLHFLVIIEGNFHYLEKEKYICLAKDFLNDLITPDDFSISFINIYEGVTKKVIQMQKNQPLELDNFLKPNRSRLNKLLAGIYGACDSFDLDPSVSKQELETHAQELLLELNED